MDMIQVFKIVHNDISMDGLFEFSDTQTHGNSKKLLKPRAFKTFRMNSFCVRSINKWNPLPDDINSKIVLQFKTLYDRHRDSGNSSQKPYTNQFIIIIITIYWNSIYLFIRQHPQLSITCWGIRPSFYSKLI